jgi:hypothetical protein
MALFRKYAGSDAGGDRVSPGLTEKLEIIDG